MYSDPRRPQHDPKPRQRKSGYWSILFYQKFRSPKQKWVPTGIQSRYFDNWQAHLPAEVNRLLVEWTRLWREGKYDPWDDGPPGQVTTKEAIDRFLADHEGAESTKARQMVSSNVIETKNRGHYLGTGDLGP